ncbi:MAG: RNA polymerase sigma-I factor [Clostridia bacterium]|nr:RNA polymerase sigma-I factor [Clostridia bacterium]
MVTDDLTELVLKAQAGDEAVREYLIKQYTPYVLKVASNFCKKFLNMGEDDEASIGLLAFNEAIDKYAPDKGANFLTFSEVVIKRRLTDYYRRENKFTSNTVSLNNYNGEENQEQEKFFEISEATKVFQIQEESFEKKQEIIEFSNALASFDITLTDLVKISPKHYDARQRAYEVAKLIVGQKELLDYLWNKKALPLKQIEEQVDVSRKTLERQRKYIIALVLILGERNFEHLRSYINHLGKEG